MNSNTVNLVTDFRLGKNILILDTVNTRKLKHSECTQAEC